MYDAIDDPYTYANSIVLVNKLELRDQEELDDFEAEIKYRMLDQPSRYPKASWIAPTMLRMQQPSY